MDNSAMTAIDEYKYSFIFFNYSHFSRLIVIWFFFSDED